jgi:hypothetical protein
MWVGRYGVAETFYFPLIAAGAQNFQNNPTIASGDALVSTDGGSTSNADNIPTVVPASGDQVKWIASASEMTGKVCTLIMSDASGSEWEDQMITVYTYGHANAHFPLDMSALISVNTKTITAGAVDSSAIATGAIDADSIASDAITAAKIATDAIDADALAADAVTEIQSGLATAADVAVWERVGG